MMAFLSSSERAWNKKEGGKEASATRKDRRSEETREKRGGKRAHLRPLTEKTVDRAEKIERRTRLSRVRRDGSYDSRGHGAEILEEGRRRRSVVVVGRDERKDLVVEDLDVASWEEKRKGR